MVRCRIRYTEILRLAPCGATSGFWDSGSFADARCGAQDDRKLALGRCGSAPQGGTPPRKEHGVCASLQLYSAAGD